MQKPKLIESNNTPKTGDMLYGENYFHKELFTAKYNNSIHKEYKDLEYFYLSAFDNNLWSVLDMFTTRDTIGDMLYNCPYIKSNTYLWMMPIAILSSDIQKYKVNAPEFYGTDMAFDFEWTSTQWPLNEYFECESKVTMALMGHGYTECTLPMDGSGDRELITIKLDNGDYVVAISHIWYNK